MRKITKLDGINVMKNEGVNQDEQIINLKLELPERLITEFKGDQNEQAMKEIEHILKDDDGDLLYYDKELNLLDNNLTPSILRLTTPNINTSFSSTKSASTANSSIMENQNVVNKAKVRIASAKRK